jgi:hypothetical protein
MKHKSGSKPYWEMTTEELREATREFDSEFIADGACELNAEMLARWQRAVAKQPKQDLDND